MKQERPSLNIKSDMLWNKTAFIQELIFLAIALIVYLVSFSVFTWGRQDRPLFFDWFGNVNAMFSDPHILVSIGIGAVAGIVIALIFSSADALVGLLSGKNIKKWVGRQDYLLPKTDSERKWALIIGFMGSSVEEVIFRCFIFLSLAPLWSGWIWAALILSAGFTLLHAGMQGFWSTIWIFCISLILCFGVHRGMSLYFLAAAHIMINYTNMFLVPLFTQVKKSSEQE